MGVLDSIIGSSGNSGSGGFSENSSSGWSSNSGRSQTSGSSSGSSTGSSFSDQSSQSLNGNRNFNYLNALFGSSAGNADEAGYQLAGTLGLRGGMEQDKANELFRNTPGYQFLQDEGARSVKSNFAGIGALQSGAAMKALQDRAMGIADQSYQGYIANLMGLGNQAQGAGQILSGAGQYGSSTSTASAGSQNQATNQSINKGFSENQGQSANESYGMSRQKSKSREGKGLVGQILSFF